MFVAYDPNCMTPMMTAIPQQTFCSLSDAVAHYALEGFVVEEKGQGWVKMCLYTKHEDDPFAALYDDLPEKIIIITETEDE